MTVVEETLFWHQEPDPDFWDDAASRCLAAIQKSVETDIPSGLIEMRRLLDQMINISEKGDFPQGTGYAEYWKTLGAVAWIASRKYINPEINARELLDVIISKQKDYGHDNILRFGRIGILVRIHDKIARLENLARRAAEPKNESLRDNYMDVINYCAIGMMVEVEWFQLELPSVAEEISTSSSN